MSPNSRRQVALVGILAVVAAASIAVWFGWIPNQRHNLRVSDAHVDRLRPVLAADARWKDIKLGSYTGGPSPGGCFWVSGRVRTAEDARTLAKIVIESKPPVPIYWRVAPDALRTFESSIILQEPFDITKIDAELETQRRNAKEAGE